jgi:ribosome maturation factor RimP
MVSHATPLLERISPLVDSALKRHGARLYDLEFSGSALRVLVVASPEIDIDVLAQISRDISRGLDEADPIPGSYELEVSTPGLERRLRTEAQFDGAVGESVAVKMVAGYAGQRRLKGRLQRVGDGTATLVLSDTGEPTQFEIDQVERATTIFEWGPGPKPGSGTKRSKKRPAHSVPASTQTVDAGRDADEPPADLDEPGGGSDEHSSNEHSSEDTRIGGMK